ncbi:hypothetical protein WDW86_07880 [Bdellovibrionota bacterium FG-2]
MWGFIVFFTFATGASIAQAASLAALNELTYRGGKPLRTFVFEETENGSCRFGGAHLSPRDCQQKKTQLAKIFRELNSGKRKARVDLPLGNDEHCFQIVLRKQADEDAQANTLEVRLKAPKVCQILENGALTCKQQPLTRAEKLVVQWRQ